MLKDERGQIGELEAILFGFVLIAAIIIWAVYFMWEYIIYALTNHGLYIAAGITLIILGYFFYTCNQCREVNNMKLEDINTWMKEHKGEIVAGTLFAAGTILLLKDVIIANSPPNLVPFVMIAISFAQFAVENLNKKEKNEVEDDKNTLAIVINDNKTTIDFLQLQAGKLFDQFGMSTKDDTAQKIIDQIQETAASAVAKNEEVLLSVAPEVVAQETATIET